MDRTRCGWHHQQDQATVLTMVVSNMVRNMPVYATAQHDHPDRKTRDLPPSRGVAPARNKRTGGRNQSAAGRSRCSLKPVRIGNCNRRFSEDLAEARRPYNLGGAEGTRTPDPHTASPNLCYLTAPRIRAFHASPPFLLGSLRWLALATNDRARMSCGQRADWQRSTCPLRL